MKRVILSALVLSVTIFFNAIAPKIDAAPPPTDLFFSEYIEGSANNKAIEIYNGTTAPVDLGAGNYVLQLYSNGSPTASQTYNLGGTIAVGDVFVMAHPSANAAILAQADDSSSVVINFNGDDAFVLRRGGSSGPILDVIGQVGLDPGVEWGTGLTSTADNTLTRKNTICAGDANPSNTFDPAIEWDGFAVDTSTSLGSHTASCGETTPPSISYTGFSNTASTANRILTATISDNVAVESGGLLPRIYFRKNAGVYFSTPCALVSGNTQNGTYDCTINNSLLGGVAGGDTVGYFVIAQDTSGNITSSPAGAVATNVNTVTTPPTPNSYTILQTYTGSLNVGAGETITSLTNNGGLFQALNAGVISGNVTINITSDLSTETGTHSLNQLTETGTGGYTITIQASGAARLILGSNATALINLNGADRVTFSGVAFGPQGLTIRNTAATGATVRIVNDASNNSILNCTVEGENTSPGSGVVFIGSGPTTGNDNNSISDSIIRDRTDAAGLPLNLIYNDSSGSAGVNSSTVITNNQLINFLQTGLFNGIAENSTINGNTIFQTATRTSNLFPIQLVGSSGTNTVSQNVIRDHSTTLAFVGINLQSIGGTATVSRNRIYNIDNSSGSLSPFAGVQLIGNVAGATANLENNMVSIVPSILASQNVYGVLDGRTNGTLNMTHNSLYLGESVGTRPEDFDSGPGVVAVKASVRNIDSNAENLGLPPNTYGFRRVSGSTTTVVLTNNIFFNNRPPGPDNYAISDESAGAGTWTSNYNLFVGTGSTAASLFGLNGVAVDFTTWKAGTPARDANSVASVAGVGPFNVANMFASPNDLHLNITGNNPAVNAGTSSGVAVDFDGQMRPFGLAADIGADEVQTAPTAADASIGGRVSTVDGRGIRNIRVTVTGGNLTEPVAAVTSAFGYFRVDGLRAGQTYVVSVAGKRYVFETPVRVVSLGEDAFDIDFVGERR